MVEWYEYTFSNRGVKKGERAESYVNGRKRIPAIVQLFVPPPPNLESNHA